MGATDLHVYLDSLQQEDFQGAWYEKLPESNDVLGAALVRLCTETTTKKLNLATAIWLKRDDRSELTSAIVANACRILNDGTADRTDRSCVAKLLMELHRKDASSLTCELDYLVAELKKTLASADLSYLGLFIVRYIGSIIPRRELDAMLACTGIPSQHRELVREIQYFAEMPEWPKLRPLYPAEVGEYFNKSCTRFAALKATCVEGAVVVDNRGFDFEDKVIEHLCHPVVDEGAGITPGNIAAIFKKHAAAHPGGVYLRELFLSVDVCGLPFLRNISNGKVDLVLLKMEAEEVTVAAIEIKTSLKLKRKAQGQVGVYKLVLEEFLRHGDSTGIRSKIDTAVILASTATYEPEYFDGELISSNVRSFLESINSNPMWWQAPEWQLTMRSCSGCAFLSVCRDAAKGTLRQLGSLQDIEDLVSLSGLDHEDRDTGNLIDGFHNIAMDDKQGLEKLCSLQEVKDTPLVLDMLKAVMDGHKVLKSNACTMQLAATEPDRVVFAALRTDRHTGTVTAVVGMGEDQWRCNDEQELVNVWKEKVEPATANTMQVYTLRETDKALLNKILGRDVAMFKKLEDTTQGFELQSYLSKGAGWKKEKDRETRFVVIAEEAPAGEAAEVPYHVPIVVSLSSVLRDLYHLPYDGFVDDNEMFGVEAEGDPESIVGRVKEELGRVRDGDLQKRLVGVHHVPHYLQADLGALAELYHVEQLRFADEANRAKNGSVLRCLLRKDDNGNYYFVTSGTSIVKDTGHRNGGLLVRSYEEYTKMLPAHMGMMHAGANITGPLDISKYNTLLGDYMNVDLLQEEKEKGAFTEIKVLGKDGTEHSVCVVLWDTYDVGTWLAANNGRYVAISKSLYYASTSFECMVKEAQLATREMDPWNRLDDLFNNPHGYNARKAGRPHPFLPKQAPAALSHAQAEAFEKGMANKISVVCGPPGTGKTFTLRYMAAELLTRAYRKGEEKMRICVTSENLEAAKQVLQGVEELLPEEIRPHVVVGCVKNRAWVAEPEGRNDSEALFLDAAPAFCILIVLTAQLGKYGIAYTKVADARCVFELPSRFEAVIVDEASKVTCPQVAVITNRLIDDGRLVVCGDPVQLQVDRKVNYEANQRMAENLLFALLRKEDGQCLTSGLEVKQPMDKTYITKLTTCFRSHRAITALSQEIYGGDDCMPLDQPRHWLTKGVGVTSGSFNDLPHMLGGLLLVEVDADNDLQKYNTMVATVVQSLVRRLLGYTTGEGKHPTFFALTSSQPSVALEDTIKALTEEGADVTAGTVARMQGKERDVVIVSLGLGTSPSLARYLCDLSKVNVSFTRAACLQVLVLAKGLCPHYVAADIEMARLGYKHIMCFKERATIHYAYCDTGLSQTKCLPMEPRFTRDPHKSVPVEDRSAPCAELPYVYLCWDEVSAALNAKRESRGKGQQERKGGNSHKGKSHKGDRVGGRRGNSADRYKGGGAGGHKGNGASGHKGRGAGGCKDGGAGGHKGGYKGNGASGHKGSGTGGYKGKNGYKVW